MINDLGVCPVACGPHHGLARLFAFNKVDIKPSSTLADSDVPHENKERVLRNELRIKDAFFVSIVPWVQHPKSHNNQELSQAPSRN